MGIRLTWSRFAYIGDSDMTPMQCVRFEICRLAVRRGGFARYSAEQAVKRAIPELVGIRVVAVALGELRWLVSRGYLIQTGDGRWLQTTATWDAVKRPVLLA